MLVHVIVNWDDVLFPTTVLKTFFQPASGEFALPPPWPEQCARLDTLVYEWLKPHLTDTRVRLLTRSPSRWVQAGLRWLPQVQRLVEWRYVELVLYDDVTRQTQMHDLLARDRRFDVYVFLGYTVQEDKACPAVLRQDPLVRWRFLQFVRQPSFEGLWWQWQKMSGLFQHFLTDPAPVLRQHFFVSHEGPPAPGWYAATSAPTTAAVWPLDKTIQRAPA